MCKFNIFNRNHMEVFRKKIAKQLSQASHALQHDSDNCETVFALFEEFKKLGELIDIHKHLLLTRSEELAQAESAHLNGFIKVLHEERKFLTYGEK